MPSNTTKGAFAVIKNIILLAVSVFVISFPISATKAVAQDESVEVTTSPESLSTPDTDIPAAQDVGDEKLPSLVVSATRYETPQNHVSSHITVITKEEISHLPGRDLAEVLNYTTGLVLQPNGGPGIPVSPSIQGSESRHVKILIDGIPLESLAQEIPLFPALSVENIERIEVLKGSASSVWGSSLGGVINIITKEPSDKPLSEVSVSAGEGNSRKYSAALSGKASGTGYFLSASEFKTDGFFENQDAIRDNIYAKLTNEIGKDLKAEISYGYNYNDFGFGSFPVSGYFSDGRLIDSYGRIKLDYSPDKDYDLSLFVYNRTSYFGREDTALGDTTPFSIMIAKENSYGVNLKPVWKHSERGVLSSGIEASYGTLDLKINDLNPLDKDRDVEKKAVYANESYRIGDLDVNIGARYDDDSVFGSELSPSLGSVYHLGKNVLVRASASRGFTPPPLTDRYFSSPYVTPNPDLKAERSWSYQAGMESDIFKALSAKITFYRADITDAISVTPIDPNDPNSLYHFKNFNKFRREGVEVEARTTEYKGLSLSYGYAFNDVRNMETDTIVEGKARVTHDAGIDYRGPYETRFAVRGHYVYWNAPASYNAKDNTFIWDAKVSKYLAKWKGVMGELFASVHNITDEKQYLMEELPNPGRWVEGGVSLTFY